MSTNLAKYKSENNYVGVDAQIGCWIVKIFYSISVLHNYFDGSTKFSILYFAKFLDTSANLFFPYKLNIIW